MMNISLTPELEKYVQNKVSGGWYTSASEVVRESLRLMHMQDKLQKQRFAQLNQAIDLGLSQIDHGQHVDGEESYHKMKMKIDKIAKADK